VLYLLTGYRGFESLLLRFEKALFAGKTLGQESGPDFLPALTTPTSTPTQPNTSFSATNTASATMNLYAPPPEVVVALAVRSDLARRKSASLPPRMQFSGYGLPRTLLLGNRVNKGKNKHGSPDPYSAGRYLHRQGHIQPHRLSAPEPCSGLRSGVYWPNTGLLWER
jgi:hypothetical protein